MIYENRHPMQQNKIGARKKNNNNGLFKYNVLINSWYKLLYIAIVDRILFYLLLVHRVQNPPLLLIQIQVHTQVLHHRPLLPEISPLELQLPISMTVSAPNMPIMQVLFQQNLTLTLLIIHSSISFIIHYYLLIYYVNR